ncbi:beta-ketoacyl-ACP synthase 3, partial [Streptomyces cavourensis]|nr:beta-ketoacyl-ACP synthase 3 [Streptomyces cavourensis]
MTGSRVVALGHYQPAKVLTNDDLAAMVDTSDEWITSRVGIKTRHVGGPDEPVDELAAHAGAKALASAGLQPSDIDLVLVATSTAIDRSPSMAARVAARLSMGSPAVLDINVVCSGFTHALAMADHTIRAGAATRALVIGADKMGDIADWTDRSTCVLLGDGAGAAVVTADPSAPDTPGGPGIGPVLWGSVPEMGNAVRIEGTPPRFAQEGQSVYRWATTQLPPIARQVCEKAGVAPEELAAVVLHQANLRII